MPGPEVLTTTAIMPEATRSSLADLSVVKPAKKEPKSTKHWEPKRKKAAYALFELIEDKTDFQYNSRSKIVRKVYEDSLNPLSGTPDYDQKYNKCYVGFTSVNEGVILMLKRLKKVEDGSDNKNLPQEAFKFWKWLRDQPEYANATIDNLIRVAKREITLAELKNATISPADEKSKISTAKPAVISVESNSQAVVEKSSDKPSLTITQAIALGTLLAGSEYKPLLQKYGINISQSQIDDDIKNILASCRQAVGASFTDTALKNSFPLLAEYLQEFVEGNRIEFLNNNTDQAKTLLKMIPGKITPDDFKLLMDDIQAILNFEPFQRREQVRLRARPQTRFYLG